jgi:predicted nucleotidyltransferase component of viral defense system
MSGKNVAHSVHQRLLNMSRSTGEDFQLLLTRYAVERLLYRLGESEHAPEFVLKGAMLFALWTGHLHRPTRDLDLLGFGDPDAERLRTVFFSLCEAAAPDDGLVFGADTVEVRPIREEQEYGGQRVTLLVRLGSARVDLQVDVGFGDAITPAAEAVEFPTLLGMDRPRLRAYPRETVVAEKLEAMVLLGLTNSRMKDFYDVVVLARTFTFDGPDLVRAVRATFDRRKTTLPAAPPVALTDAFAADDAKRRQWAAFRKRGGSEVEKVVGDLDGVVAEVRGFLGPILSAAAMNGEFSFQWPPGGPWRQAG